MKLKEQVERARLAGLPTFTCEHVCQTCGTFERYASGVCIQCNRDRVKRCPRKSASKQGSLVVSSSVLRIHRAFNLAVSSS